jgi:hypothetical protein
VIFQVGFQGDDNIDGEVILPGLDSLGDIAKAIP